MDETIRHDIFAIKANLGDGAGWGYVFMTKNRQRAIARRDEICKDSSLGIVRRAKVVYPAQWVVDRYLAVGNSIE